MRRINMDRGWEFFLEAQNANNPAVSGAGGKIDLPHDFVIYTDPSPDAVSGPLTGYYNGGLGSYSKMIEIPVDWKDKKVIAEFDGVYNIAIVGLNGNQIAIQPYGYTPFHVDLTHFLKFGVKNRLHVTANNTALPNSRWYTGGGIYRHVDLLISPLIYIAPWGIFAYTDRVEKDRAYVICEVTIVNETGMDAELSVQVAIGPVGEKTIENANKSVYAAAGEKLKVKLDIVVTNVRLWDIDDPFLYNVTAQVTERDRLLDIESATFGIRTISADPKNGFQLNGRTLKLKGGCVHHDNGILGAASFRDSEFRKVKLLKDNDYNALRCAHNPPSRDLLDACDRLGMLVINEAFDMWRIGKSTNDYHLFFEDWWKRDMEAFITRDRNHPCVIMWSTGNEIVERGGLADGYETARKLAEYARQIDTTRLITNSVCSMWSGLNDFDSEKVQKEFQKITAIGGSVQNVNMSYIDSIWGDLTEDFVAPLDVVGYNYLHSRYGEDGKKYPDRVICGTESVPISIAMVWDAVEKYAHVIGDFAWTGFDYIGEAGIGKCKYAETDQELGLAVVSNQRSEYPWRLANCGDFDICGFPRPQLYYRKIVWGSPETYIAVQNPICFGKKEAVSYWGWPERVSSWTWDGFEGQPINIDVYSASDEVELILNGKSIARKAAGKANRYTAKFEHIYEPGTLVAVSYTDGKEVSRCALDTAGKPVRVVLKVERDVLPADGQSLAYVICEIVDAYGNRVPNVEVPAKATVTGAASLAGFGNGKPITEENYTTGRFTSYEGRLLAIVRAAYEPGTAELTVECDGFEPVIASFSVLDQI